QAQDGIRDSHGCRPEGLGILRHSRDRVVARHPVARASPARTSGQAETHIRAMGTVSRSAADPRVRLAVRLAAATRSFDVSLEYRPLLPRSKRLVNMRVDAAGRHVADQVRGSPAKRVDEQGCEDSAAIFLGCVLLCSRRGQDCRALPQLRCLAQSVLPRDARMTAIKY